MSGERPPVHVEATAGSVLARAVEALGRFPADRDWTLVGGIAVFVRLGSVTRPTTDADADAVARSQAELVDRLVVDEIASVISGGELQVPIGDGGRAASASGAIGLCQENAVNQGEVRVGADHLHPVWMQRAASDIGTIRP